MSFNSVKGEYEYYDSGFVYTYQPLKLGMGDAYFHVCRNESTTLNVEKDGKLVSDGVAITLHVWVSVFGKAEYGVSLDCFGRDNEFSYQFYITDEGKPDPDRYNEEEIEFVGYYTDMYSDDINELIIRAKNKWNLK